MPRPLALTMGEPAGIGGEITLKAWQAERAGIHPFFVIADPEYLSVQAKDLNLDVPVRTIGAPAEAAAVFPHALPALPLPLPEPAHPGQPDTRNAEAVLGSISRAVALVQAGDAAAVVTNPIHKKVLADAGFAHPGHTEYLGELTGAERPTMMLACPGLRVVPVTVHLPLADAIAAITTEAIAAAGRITAEALVRDFAIAEPIIAIAGLNPHAGEQGMLGREEEDVIVPAVQTLIAEGINVTGPAPADSLFHARARKGYDAVLCMYHDQALIPLKTIDFDNGVDITLGLPIIRTSPDHGTAFEIAGRGIARPDSLVASLRTARTMAENRRSWEMTASERPVLAED